MAGLDPAIRAISNGVMRRIFYVYILASMKRGTLYIGVTNDIARRLSEHRAGIGGVFTKRYGVLRLVYYEEFATRDRSNQARKIIEEMAA
jgi:putative endonuclease